MSPTHVPKFVERVTRMLTVSVAHLCLLVGPQTFILAREFKVAPIRSYFIPDFILSKVYANSLLATLNVRAKWKDEATAVPMSFNAASNSNGSTVGTRPVTATVSYPSMIGENLSL